MLPQRLFGLHGAALQRLDDAPHARPKRTLDHHGIACGDGFENLRFKCGRALRIAAAALEPQILGAINSDDALMIKGSLGSRMGPIVKALKRRYASSETAPVQG